MEDAAIELPHFMFDPFQTLPALDVYEFSGVEINAIIRIFFTPEGQA